MAAVKYPVNEIFRSIQGEGAFTGQVVTFVRLAGCNLSCPWCDTDHSEKQRLTGSEIVEEVYALDVDEDEVVSTPWIVITGGEPFLHDLTDLLKAYKPSGGIYGRVCVETNGTLWSASTKYVREQIDWLTVSPKAGYLTIALPAIAQADEVKLVWDERLAPALVKPYIPIDLFRQRRCFIQPCSERFAPAIDYVLRHPEWRLSIQLHKVLGMR